MVIRELCFLLSGDLHRHPGAHAPFAMLLSDFSAELFRVSFVLGSLHVCPAFTLAQMRKLLVVWLCIPILYATLVG